MNEDDLLGLLHERVEVVWTHGLPLLRVSHEVDGKGHDRQGLPCKVK